MPSIEPIKDIVMSHTLGKVTAIVMLAVATTDVAYARAINDQHHHFRRGYAGMVYSQAPRELGPWNVPGRGVAAVTPQFNNPSLQVKGYGCLAHPDYGLYTPHFC
jgi:hypothetical protein